MAIPQMIAESPPIGEALVLTPIAPVIQANEDQSVVTYAAGKVTV